MKKINIKKIIIFTMLILIIFTAVLIFIFRNDSLALLTYDGYVTVNERRSGKDISVTLDEDPNNINRDLVIHSNIFWEGDKLKITYYKYKKEYKISYIDPLVESELEKRQLINNILADPTMIRYEEKLTREKKYEEEYSKIYAMPDLIKGQRYKMISPSEVFKIIHPTLNEDNFIINKDELIKIKSSEAFIVEKFTNYYNNKETDINYEYTDIYDKDKITFTGVGKGIYNLKIKFKNGDIIDYIFI